MLIKNSVLYQSHPIELVIGEPIDTSDYTEDNITELIELTRQSVIAGQGL